MNVKNVWILYVNGGDLPCDVKAVFDAHIGHELKLVRYGKYYAIECENCGEVLFDDETMSCM